MSGFWGWTDENGRVIAHCRVGMPGPMTDEEKRAYYDAIWEKEFPMKPLPFGRSVNNPEEETLP